MINGALFALSQTFMYYSDLDLDLVFEYYYRPVVLHVAIHSTCVALQIVGISKSWALHIIVCRSGNLYAIICNAHDFGAHDLQHGDFQDRGHFLCSYCSTITFMLA